MKCFIILFISLFELTFLVLDLILYANLIILTNYDNVLGLKEDSD